LCISKSFDNQKHVIFGSMEQHFAADYFYLESIRVKEFSVNYRDVDPRELEADINPIILLDLDDSALEMELRISLFDLGKEVMALDCNFTFIVEEYFWDRDLGGKTVHLSHAFLTHLLMIATGTSRGIFHTLKPEWLDGFVLELLDLRDVFPMDGMRIQVA